MCIEACFNTEGHYLLLGSREQYFCLLLLPCMAFAFVFVLLNCFYLDPQTSCFIFPLPSPFKESDRVGLVGIWPPARVKPPHQSRYTRKMPSSIWHLRTFTTFSILLSHHSPSFTLSMPGQQCLEHFLPLFSRSHTFKLKEYYGEVP